MRAQRWVWGVAILLGVLAGNVRGEEGSAERGREVITERSLLGPGWKASAYRSVGKLWSTPAPDPEQDPEAYSTAFARRYGLNSAPYPNDGLPMGLKRGVLRDGTKSGVQIDCLMCHGGSIGGTSIVGLGNTQIDAKRLFDELTLADGRVMPPTTFVMNSARGTVNAGMLAAVLLSLRNPDLSRRLFPLSLEANLPELDTPPWWHLARKTTMYYDGRTPADSVRTNMQFLLGEKSLKELQDLEPTFRDIQAYFRSLRPPQYPFPIDATQAERGRAVYETTCARCHGTYGAGGSYPSKIVELEVIATDPARAFGLSDKLVAHFNATWLGENHPANPEMVGYQAPPLDGIWATAPYLHNGSVPTLAQLLQSKDRPSRFLRPPSTSFEHYDRERVGWKCEPVDTTNATLDPETARRLFDASRFGLGNGGHTFGDRLTDDERRDVIEYLKTL